MKIIFVGLSGVPYLQRAADNRLMAFAKVFNSLGHKIFISNRLCFETNKKGFNNFDREKIEILNWGLNNSNLNFLRIFWSFIFEFFNIIKLNKKNKIDFIQVYSGHFIEILFYKTLSVVINAKLIYQYVEFRSSITGKGLYHKYNGILVDYYAPKMYEGVISISTYISNHLSKVCADTSVIQIPPICDFNFFDSITKNSQKGNYILFCGSAEYFEIFELIIKAYHNSECKSHNIKLHFVLSGKPDKVLQILNLIEDKEFITVESKLPYKELIQTYKNAQALLIPLRNSIQDASRFPNKICEYCASQGLILTSSFGEIPYYFKNRENALIVEDNSINSWTKTLNQFIELESKDAESIKQNSYITGKKYFNIESYQEDFDSFLKNVKNN